MSKIQAEFEPNVISETETFGVWLSDDAEEGTIYHIELGGITLHMTTEEWDEFVIVIKGASK